MSVTDRIAAKALVLALAGGLAAAPPVVAQQATTASAQAIQPVVPPVVPQVSPFQRALAEALAADAELLAFYRMRGFAGLWSAAEDAERRNAALRAFLRAEDHGLPLERYGADGLVEILRAADTPERQAEAEIALTRAFLRYAHDVSSGLLEPGQVIPDIHRSPNAHPHLAVLQGVAGADPAGYIRGLAPQSQEYAELAAAKIRLEQIVAQGGWGPQVPPGTQRLGAGGANVVALRNRLIAMGFLAPTTSETYDETLRAAVLAFQAAHGLDVDGTAGPSTLGMVNVPAEERLRSVLVAMERERWMNRPLGERHVWVNLADFNVRLIEGGEVIFQTRSVVGANVHDRRSPEFSDQMEYMVVNPSWNVPRSIVTKEFLPQLWANRFALPHLEVVDGQGRVLDRRFVNFRQYSPQSFPFLMREPPSQGNALGLVKFMFPNPYNIYLHDTPAKSLFSQETRAYSHGCVRLGDPFGFARALLEPQVADPEAFFRARLATGREQIVGLETPVPVHLVYRTAFHDPGEPMQFRRDVYGRDALIWEALAAQGVAIRAAGG